VNHREHFHACALRPQSFGTSSTAMSLCGDPSTASNTLMRPLPSS
jgi:hypothetical protein